MSQPPSAVPDVTPEARPVDSTERLALLDVLRGFALCGVFVSNVYMWFSGRTFVPRAQIDAAMASASLGDKVASYAIGILVFGKFITLFAFLFGLGFSVQMSRAEARGATIAPLYMRRLGVMFLLGAVHLLGLWYGDILTTYALLGFALLLFRNRTDKTLLFWAVPLILVAPLGVDVLMKALPMLTGVEASMEASTQRRAQTLEVFTTGTYFDVVRANASYYFNDFMKPLLAVMFGLLGRFLLGLVAGRQRLFHDAPQHLPLFRKLLGWGLLFGVIGSAVMLWVRYLLQNKLIDGQAPWLMVTMPLRQLNEVGLAAVYLSGIVLLFQRPAWQRRLLVLAPVGRMALTNYLTQTVLSLCFFYGFGLGFIGKLGPAALTVLPLGVFCVQVAFSHWWLARFRFGPAEWVWRSLTYGKAQPMRQPVATPPAPVADENLTRIT
ncbi:DUF418 domain-containing protein [Archangium sp.]|uniref:DUF418 domain-containing protein n=1 Tax=Archangium sp. TaxID=1872627 RepID=UPI00286B5DA0|nr:DUF418 domain-containing protein [Archangium sp.]